MAMSSHVAVTGSRRAASRTSSTNINEIGLALFVASWLAILPPVLAQARRSVATV
jgi:hypothetical protein